MVVRYLRWLKAAKRQGVTSDEWIQHFCHNVARTLIVLDYTGDRHA